MLRPETTARVTANDAHRIIRDHTNSGPEVAPAPPSASSLRAAVEQPDTSGPDPLTIRAIRAAALEEAATAVLGRRFHKARSDLEMAVNVAYDNAAAILRRLA